MPLKVNIQLFRQPYILVSTAMLNATTSNARLFFFEGDGWGLHQNVTQTKKTTEELSVVSCISMHQKVEAAGVEPASKLGTQKLSTRLFCD